MAASKIFKMPRSFTLSFTKVCLSLLIIAGSLSQITTPARAETDAPINFLSLSVCSDRYLIGQIVICVPKNQNYVAQLSVNYINKGFTQSIVSDGKVIVPFTSKMISLSELPAASYQWQLFSTSTSQTPVVIRDVNFKIVDLPIQQRTSQSVKSSIDTTFVESYVLRYEDKSLESLLTDDLGFPRENLKSGTLMSSMTGKQIAPSSSSHLIEIGLTKIQLNRLSSDKRVLGLEKNMIRYSSTTQGSAPWNLDRLDQESLPLNNSFTYEIGSATPVIYVLDTGCLLYTSDAADE